MESLITPAARNATPIPPLMNPIVLRDLASASRSAFTDCRSSSLGGADSDLVNAVATFANGDVLVAGTFRGTINLGGADLMTTATATNSFVARLAALDGAHVWSMAITAIALTTLALE